MTSRSYRAWAIVHSWTSLISTLFMLLLCVTGLPLIFHHEIADATSKNVPVPAMAAGTPHADLDDVVRAGKQFWPERHLQFLSWDDDDANLILLFFGTSPSSDPEKNRILRVDARTALVLDELDLTGSLVQFLLKLHTHMFLGLPGKLFLGAMGVLFVTAIVSGLMIYKPSMGKLSFGEIRFERIRSIRWLDLHNLLSVAIVAWMLVVGVTGIINTLSDVVVQSWQAGQLKDMIGQNSGRPVPAQVASLQAAVSQSRRALPAMQPIIVAYPGSMFSSSSHYAVYMKGSTPLTSRLYQPVLIDAVDGSLTDTRPMPWYVMALFISSPLHFGDYGGMPLKIIWALLDVITIVVLGSGVYLWIARRRWRGSRSEAHSALQRTEGLTS